MHFFSSTSLFLAAVPLVMGNVQQVEIFREASGGGHRQIVQADRNCHALDAPLKKHVGSIRIPSSVECEVYGGDNCTDYLTEVYSPGDQHFNQPYGHDTVAVICGVDLLI